MQKLIKPSVDRRYVDLTVSFAPEADGDEDLPGPPVRYYFSRDGVTPWHLPRCHPQTSCVLILSCKLLYPSNLGQTQEPSHRMLPDKDKTSGLCKSPLTPYYVGQDKASPAHSFSCFRFSQWNMKLLEEHLTVHIYSVFCFILWWNTQLCLCRCLNWLITSFCLWQWVWLKTVYRNLHTTPSSHFC